MFEKFINLLKAVYYGRSLKDMYEETVLQSVVQEATKIEETIESPIVEAIPEVPVIAAIPAAVNDQITDSVTQVKPKRARTAKGKLKADDKSTPDVNEAWVGGKAPVKKTKPKKSKSKKNK